MYIVAYNISNLSTISTCSYFFSASENVFDFPDLSITDLSLIILVIITINKTGIIKNIFAPPVL